MMSLGNFVFLLVVFAVNSVAGLTVTANKSYCELCTTHTMCLYPNASTKCSSFLAEGVDGTDITQILKLHNDFRSLVAMGSATRGLAGSVQPPASNMRRMEWDSELAQIAQRWSNQCVWGHDKCRTVNRFRVGQNAYTGSKNRDYRAPNWTAAVTGWFDEIDLFDSHKVNFFEYEAATSHYTQLVWAETWLVGCGFTYFLESPWYTKIYQCNYGPAGNWVKKPLYLQGAAATRCPNDTVANLIDGLCDTTSTFSTELAKTTVSSNSTLVTSSNMPLTANSTSAKSSNSTSQISPKSN